MISKSVDNFKKKQKRFPQLINRKIKFVSPQIVGAYSEQNEIFLAFLTNDRELKVAKSDNAVDFQLTDFELPRKSCDRIQVCELDLGNFALLSMYGKTKDSEKLYISFLKSHQKWSVPTEVSLDLKKTRSITGTVVTHYQLDGKYLMFIGGQSIETATSDDLKKWKVDESRAPFIKAQKREVIEIDLAIKLQQGILLCYRRVSINRTSKIHQVHMALVSSFNPSQIIWQSQSPIWENSKEWGTTSFGGAVVFRSQVYGFWNTKRLGIVLVRYPVEGIPFEFPRDHITSLKKAKSNPILFPRGEFAWEAFATYNPAAFYADGKVHILYRAQGHDLISSIGYASSQDGVKIDERLDEPIYRPQEVFESFQLASPKQVEKKYVSGGGIAGCEDPRVTLMGDRVFMTYVAFDGASPPRVALTSIALTDFLAKRWLWERPVLISPPGIVDKSAVIFPEKINGKFVIMHRIFPDILIDYQDNLNFDGSRWLKTESKICIRENMWDSRKIGAGAPPIKTPEGWLLIYYGVDDRNDRYYKMGAMLLDLEDPSKVLYRSSTPIIEPEDWYENSGFKPGIVYPCGAVLIDKQLFVYYGGADCVVCVATADLNKFIKALKSNNELKLEKQKMQRVGNHATYKIQIKSDYQSQH